MTIAKLNAKIKGAKTLSPDDRVELFEASIELEDEITVFREALRDIPDEEPEEKGEPSPTVPANSGKLKDEYRTKE